MKENYQHHDNIDLAPGIGVQDNITISNNGTRAVLVCGDLINVDRLSVLSHQLEFQPGINRYILKAIVSDGLPVGSQLDGGAMRVEASIPFSFNGERKYWVVAGCNIGERSPDEELVCLQRKIIAGICLDAKYQPQNGEDLLSFAQNSNPQLHDLSFITINSGNFKDYEQCLRSLYHQAFVDYPYDVVTAIGESCDRNIFVAIGAILNGQEQVVSITGAEFMNISGVSVAEVGDSASLPDIRGFGPVIKRYLLQRMCESGRIPDLLFTDSRIAADGSAIKANRRAGFILDQKIILPWHTNIASDRNPGSARQIIGLSGLINVENMTMTYADQKRVIEVIETYGGMRQEFDGNNN